MAKKRGGSLADLQRATDLLSGLLAQEARALDKRRREEGCGDMKAMKEITAVLKDLAAVAKSLGEQQGEGGAGKIRVLGEKTVCDLLVLLRQDGAGGVHQGAAGLHVPGGVIENRPLDHRQGEQLVGLLVPDVRLLADDAQA